MSALRRFAGGGLIAFAMMRLADFPMDGFIAAVAVLVGIDLLADARGK